MALTALAWSDLHGYPVRSWSPSWHRVLACRPRVTVAVSPRLNYFLGSTTTLEQASSPLASFTAVSTGYYWPINGPPMAHQWLTNVRPDPLQLW